MTEAAAPARTVGGATRQGSRRRREDNLDGKRRPGKRLCYSGVMLCKRPGRCVVAVCVEEVWSLVLVAWLLERWCSLTGVWTREPAGCAESGGLMLMVICN